MLKGPNASPFSIKLHPRRKVYNISQEKSQRDFSISSLPLYRNIFHHYKQSNYHPFHNSSYEKDSKSVRDYKTSFSKSTSSVVIIKGERMNSYPSSSYPNDNHAHLLKRIQEERKKNAMRISCFFKRQHTLLSSRRNALLATILRLRNDNIIKLQAAIRAFLVKKHIKSLLAYDYIFFYTPNEDSKDLIIIPSNKTITTAPLTATAHDSPSYGTTNQDIRLLLFGEPGKKKESKFSYSKELQRYYIPFLKRRVIKQRYRVNFILNGHVIIDSRYEIDNDAKGNFFNVLLKSLLHKITANKREKRETPFLQKYSELFKMKSYRRHSNSWDSLSISNTSIISNECFNTCPIPQLVQEASCSNIKPILKNASCQIESYTKRRSSNVIHKVSFNQNVEYSY